MDEAREAGTMPMVEVAPNNLARLDRKIDDLLGKTSDMQCRVVRIEAQHEHQSSSIKRIDDELRHLGHTVVGLRIRTGGFAVVMGLILGIITTLVTKGLLK